jgi:hypothetical protein
VDQMTIGPSPEDRAPMKPYLPFLVERSDFLAVAIKARGRSSTIHPAACENGRGLTVLHSEGARLTLERMP